MDRITFNPLLRWISARIKQNKNAIIIINGSTGSGKTYTALSLALQIAQELGTSFTIKDNMDFNFTGLLQKTMLPQNTKPGTCFLFEEVGSMASGSASREWQSQANKFFFSFMQTSRHRNQILIMTCPHFSFLERGVRSLVHLQCEMSSIDYSRKIALLKVYRIQVNSRTGMFYFKYLRIIANGQRSKLKLLEVPHPDVVCAGITAEYERLKTQFTTNLNKSMIKEEPKPKIKEQCPFCLFKWFKKVAVPLYCPKCKKALNLPKPIIPADMVDNTLTRST